MDLLVEHGEDRAPRDVSTPRASSVRVLGLGLSMLWFCIACRSARDGAQGLRVPDSSGKLVAPLDVPAARAVVLLFVMSDCPISNAFAPEIERIRAEYAPRGVDFDLVYADPAETGARARAHAADFGHASRVLLDPEHVLVRLAGATRSPEAAVLSPAGEVLYLGRIDDRYADYGKLRVAPRTRDLRSALEAVLANRRPEPARTEVVGCFLPEPRPAAH
jgi:hypothetical protein